MVSGTYTARICTDMPKLSLRDQDEHLDNAGDPGLLPGAPPCPATTTEYEGSKMTCILGLGHWDLHTDGCCEWRDPPGEVNADQHTVWLQAQKEREEMELGSAATASKYTRLIHPSVEAFWGDTCARRRAKNRTVHWDDPRGHCLGFLDHTEKKWVLVDLHVAKRELLICPSKVNPEAWDIFKQYMVTFGGRQRLFRYPPISETSPSKTSV